MQVSTDKDYLNRLDPTEWAPPEGGDRIQSSECCILIGQSYKRLIENIPYSRHKCSDSTGLFQKAKNKWKTSIVREDLQPQKRTTMWKE
jgi:hypothetical protein